MLGLDEVTVNSGPSGHQTVSKVGVLVENKLSATKFEGVLVVAFWHFLWKTVWSFAIISWLENNLSRTASQIKYGSGWDLFWRTDVSKQVIGCNPGINTLILAFHNLDTALGLRDNREWVDSLQPSSDGLKNIVTHVFA
ncbi:hypothetical protein H113_03892 [Trichophyton rubrum MR1459]|uniref:Uncharacterized protein n=1 Tax=Trichophyton rubrum (strain ATCC MYA-4607 / CBS 118892) TaxID=559305 RepID=A0A080WNN2_TRIRC|nr:uncharacterized protein TERG_12244 [Trichophyton rubrum CBS 118892]EZF95779.1 hypothetical protein H113_03892 [Trichophyton rubrum MR1459]EZG06948.1 hypothetical protein H106_03678 [Trichophyton rubrum CBS 735.88]KFL61870.1 hypothetical protein TERG_12244 [Trichophyton rubrum CBS 118892]